MTVSSGINRVSHNGNGVTTAFPFSYLFYDEDDLTVIAVDADGVETVKTITTDYTVTGAGSGSGGTVTMLVAPASGTKLVILREVDYTQDLDLVEGDPLPPDSLEEAIDRIAMMAGQVKEITDRALKFPRGDSSSLTTELPSAADRINKVACFDASGNATVSERTLDEIEAAADFADEAEASAAAAASSASAAAASADAADTSADAAAVDAAAIAAIVASYTGGVTIDRFNGTGAQTAFTLTNDPGSENNTSVYISGVYQQKDTYSVAGTTLTFSTAPASGTGNVEVAYGTTLPIGTPGDATVTNAKMANMAANTIKGNATAGAASPTDIALSASKLLGRPAAGNIGEIGLGSGMSLSGSNLVATSRIGASASQSVPTINGAAVQWTGGDGWLSVTITTTQTGTSVARYNALCDAAASPTHVWDSAYFYGHTAANNATGESLTLNFPVRNNDYYQITSTDVSGTTTETVASMYFRALTNA